MARPTIFTRALAERICESIVNGLSLRKACEKKGMPTVRTVMRWVASNGEFCQQYRVAKGIQADLFADELIAMADAATPETLARVRLQVDTRKWVAARMNPKKWG